MRLSERIAIEKENEAKKNICKSCSCYRIYGEEPYSGFQEPQHIRCTLNPELDFLCAGDELSLYRSCPLKENPESNLTMDDCTINPEDIGPQRTSVPLFQNEDGSKDEESSEDLMDVFDYMFAKALDDTATCSEETKDNYEQIFGSKTTEVIYISLHNIMGTTSLEYNDITPIISKIEEYPGLNDVYIDFDNIECISMGFAQAYVAYIDKLDKNVKEGYIQTDDIEEMLAMIRRRGD